MHFLFGLPLLALFLVFTMFSCQDRVYTEIPLKQIEDFYTILPCYMIFSQMKPGSLWKQQQKNLKRKIFNLSKSTRVMTRCIGSILNEKKNTIAYMT